MQRIFLASAVALTLAACNDDVSHGNCDRWMNVEGGPGKLRGAVKSTSVDADLSAHCAVSLVLIKQEKDVIDAFAEMGSARRDDVLEKLGPRLWEVARIEGEMMQPDADQVAAKDLLFTLREHTTGDLRAAWDRYLIDWYTSGWYEARAGVGRWSGAQVMRALGKQAGSGMIDAINMVVSMPPPAENKRVRVGDDLMLGLAVTGDPAAVKYLLDLTRKGDIDPSLPDRAIDALHNAFVEPPGALFEPADPAGLAPNHEALAQIATDPESSNHMANRALVLLAAAGMPHCLPPLVEMIKSRPATWWVGADNALRCGKIEAIDDVAAALPTGQGYELRLLEDNVIEPIEKMTPAPQVLAAVEPLLGAESWVARWVAIEVIARLGSPADAAKLEALARDGQKLKGYHGDQSEVPKGERKPEPTLGKRAGELAAAMTAKSQTP